MFIIIIFDREHFLSFSLLILKDLSPSTSNRSEVMEIKYADLMKCLSNEGKTTNIWLLLIHFEQTYR